MTIHTNPGELRRKAVGERLDDQNEIASVMEALKARDAEIKSFAEKATAEIKDTGKMAVETKAALDKISTDAASLTDRLMAVEQKMSRRSFGGEAAKSIGAQFTESDEFKALASKGRGSATMNFKATTITSATTDAAGSAGDAIVVDRRPGILMPAERELTIRDLLMPGRTASNAIEYVKETGFNNNAATVAEAGARAQSDIKLDLVTTNVKNIGHFVVASKNILADVPQLQSYIDTRLRYGLKQKEEDQILAGDGTGNNLSGLLTEAPLFKESLYSGTDDTKIDTIRRACLQVRVAELKPTFVVLNPNDWADIELTKDTTGRYIWVNIQVGGTMQIWRLAVVETSAITSGQFLVGATMGAQVFDREDATITVSTEHSDYFTNGKAAILGEERLALAVYRPESFVHGYFDILESPSSNA